MTRRATGVLIALATACGEPAHDGDYEGEVIAEIHCTYAFTVEGGGPRQATMDIGLVWLTEHDGAVEARQQRTRDIGTWPTSKLQLDHLPDDHVLRILPGYGRVALGQIIAWDDVDQDFAWTPDERVLALSRLGIVVYAPPPRPDDPPSPFTPGFHVVVPNRCDSDKGRLDLEGRHPGCLIEPAPDPPDVFFRFTCP